MDLSWKIVFIPLDICSPVAFPLKDSARLLVATSVIYSREIISKRKIGSVERVLKRSIWVPGREQSVLLFPLSTPLQDLVYLEMGVVLYNLIAK